MAKIEIKELFPQKVIFSGEFETLKEAVEAAVREKVSLRRADLTRANLTRANLTGADLTRADLFGADLTRANLTRANLFGADLFGADLTRANLTGADLTRADLFGADLTRANLTQADLTRANLTQANLTQANLFGADLTEIKEDFMAKISRLPEEAPYLYDSILKGKIDGSMYKGECSCFCGTLAKAKGTSLKDLGIEVDPSSPVESFFTGIRPGHTPKNNPVSKIVATWTEEFLKGVSNE